MAEVMLAASHDRASRPGFCLLPFVVIFYGIYRRAAGPNPCRTPGPDDMHEIFRTQHPQGHPRPITKGVPGAYVKTEARPSFAITAAITASVTMNLLMLLVLPQRIRPSLPSRHPMSSSVSHDRNHHGWLFSAAPGSVRRMPAVAAANRYILTYLTI